MKTSVFIIISAFIPGVAQAYRRQWLKAFLWGLTSLLATALSFTLVPLGIVLLGFGGISPLAIALPLGMLVVPMLPGVIAGWIARPLKQPDSTASGLKRSVVYAIIFLGITRNPTVSTWMSALLISQHSNRPVSEVFDSLRGTPKARQAADETHFRNNFSLIAQHANYVFIQEGSYGSTVNPGDCVHTNPGSLFSSENHPPSSDPKANNNIYGNIVGILENNLKDGKGSDFKCFSTPTRYAIAAKIPGKPTYLCIDSTGRSVDLAQPATGPSCDPTEAFPEADLRRENTQ